MEAIGNGVWVQEGDLVLPGGAPFTTRSTVVRLSDGDLWVHAPVKPSDDWVEELRGLGSVSHIVAPNAFHHLFLKKFSAAFPEARTYAPPALFKKRPDIPWHAKLQVSLWPEDFDVTPVLGAAKLNEFTFLHRASRTLIATDVLFHFPRVTHWKTKLITWLANSAPGPRVSRLLRFVTDDKTAFLKSIRTIARQDFDRLVMAHGDVINSDGPAVLRAAYEHRFGPIEWD